MGQQFMAVIGIRSGLKGKVYLSGDDAALAIPNDAIVEQRIEELSRRTGLSAPQEIITDDAKNSFWVRLYGLTTYGQLFTPRQKLCLLTFCAAVRTVYAVLDLEPGDLAKF